MTTCIIVTLQLVGFTASSYTGSDILGVCMYCIGNEKTACVWFLFTFWKSSKSRHHFSYVCRVVDL